MSSLKLKTKKIRSNLYITALYIAVTQYTTGYWTTLRKYCHMCSVKLICIKRSPLYNGCGHPLDSQNAQFDYIFYLFITVHKLDYDQIKDKIQDVCSKVDGKMNASKIVESVNLFMAIEWGTYKR